MKSQLDEIKNGTFQKNNISINELEMKIHSFKHHIHNLRQSLQNELKKNSSLYENIKAFKEVTNDKKLMQDKVMWLDDIFKVLCTLRSNEAKLRIKVSDKEKKIKDLMFQKDFLLKQLKHYETHWHSNNLTCEILKRQVLSPPQKENKKVKVIEPLQHTLIPSILKVENVKQSQILIIEQLNNLGMIHLKMLRLSTFRYEQYLSINHLQLDYNEILKKWVNQGRTLPIHNMPGLNIVKRGSWIKLVWKWLFNDNNLEEDERTLDLSNTIKDLQSKLSSYEDLLLNMNSNFERFNQNEQLYTKEIAELKDQLMDLIENEKRNLEVTDQLKGEVLIVDEQNSLLKEKIIELELQTEHYKLEIEQLRKKGKEKIHQINPSFKVNKDQKKMNQEIFQKVNQSQNSPIPTFTRELKKTVKPTTAQTSQMSKQNKPLNKANSRIQTKLELMKKFYPQASRQGSVFNPFKY